MAIDPSVKVDIAVEYKGKKAFDQADKATQKLTNNVKKLAGAFSLAFSTRAVVNFAKDSIKAFAEDDAAITVLRQNLKNLGLAYQSQNAENFIAGLEEQAGILDDHLRPAYAQLSKVTLSTTKTQELMALAVDVARANGLEFSEVIDTLSRAYVGNYRGLKNLNTGLTDAQLKTKSFAEIQEILIKQSQGAGKAYIETFAGSIDKLAVASANAKEVIGEGLVDLFSDIAGNGDINQATANVNLFATAVSDLLKDIDKLTALDYLGVFLTGSITKESADKLKKRASARRFYTGGSGVSTDLLNAKKAAELEKKRVAAELAANKAKELAFKKALLSEKAKAALTKAAATFDLNKIQIAAALKATYDQDTRLRLLAMQAIENDNGEAALKYIEQLARLTGQQQTDKLNGLKGIGEVELAAINKLLLAELDRIDATKMSEADKAAARQEAYRKYNAAIIESGGLADKNFYSEELQIQLLEIARLASIHKVQAAQATLDILNYTTQTQIIDRVAAAQKIADDAKMQALKDYLALLGTTAGIIGALPGGGGGGKAPVIPPTIFPPGFGGGGQPIAPGYGGIFDYVPPTGSTGSGSSDNSVTIIVEGNILNGDEFGDIVNNAILDNIRRGFSQNPAGAIPIP
jgi:hypothetical protein